MPVALVTTLGSLGRAVLFDGAQYRHQIREFIRSSEGSMHHEEYVLRLLR